MRKRLLAIVVGLGALGVSMLSLSHYYFTRPVADPTTQTSTSSTPPVAGAATVTTQWRCVRANGSVQGQPQSSQQSAESICGTAVAGDGVTRYLEEIRTTVRPTTSTQTTTEVTRRIEVLGGTTLKVSDAHAQMILLGGGTTVPPPDGGGGEDPMEEIGAGCANPTVTLLSAASSTVQAAIDNASNGDCIQLPQGATATWGANAVVIPSTKGITLDGNGSTITRASNTGNFAAPLILNVSDAGPSRITNINMVSGGGNSANENFIRISTDEDENDPYFRLDHFTLDGEDIGVHIYVAGSGYGLIDNCTIISRGNDEVIQHQAYGAGDNTGWTQVVTPGSLNALYVEDCVFLNQDPNQNAGKVFATYGARTVYRFNELWRLALDMHGNIHPTGRWFEFYNNEMKLDNGNNVFEWAVIRGGTGVIFGNVANGNNNGAGSIRFYEDSDDGDNGPWPQAYQVGMGRLVDGTHERQPAYAWGNTGDDGFTYVFPTDEDLVVQLNRDVFLDTSNNGVRSGTLAELAEIECETDYHAFWATDSGPLWNNGESGGELYRCLDGEWEKYYTPATYPHPLRFGVQGP